MSQQTISIFSRGNKTLIETKYTIGPRFDETDSNGVRRIGYRAGAREFVQTGIHPGGGKTPAGTKLGYYIEGAPEQVIWTLRPDGTATLERKLFTPTFGREGMPGVPEYTYNFSAEGLKVFRMVASQFPDGIIERGISVNGLKWPAWDFPFTATDSANMRAWVISLTPADAFAIYYNLLAYDGKEFSRCTYRKFNPSISPAEFEANWFWPVFQDMVAMAIYNIRTDLHKVRDPETGEIIDGLIKYDLFRMPCKPGPGEIVFQVIASAALAVVTAGAGAALAASLKTISFAKSIHDMKSGADKAKAQAAFTNSVVRGFQSGVQIENILTPAPTLTPEEEKLIERASGEETKSPTETGVVVGEAVKGSGFPWLLLAGAAAAALLS
jgi:hypothetical protein